MRVLNCPTTILKNVLKVIWGRRGWEPGWYVGLKNIFKMKQKSEKLFSTRVVGKKWLVPGAREKVGMWLYHLSQLKTESWNDLSSKNNATTSLQWVRPG